MSERIDLAKSWFQVANAVEARYPEPENSLSIERAREAISIAHQVRNRILEKLNM
jgi:hypothetical protein